MYSLEYLQQIGCMSGSLQEVDWKRAVAKSQVFSLSDAEQARFDGVVVCDSAKWVATVSGMPIEKAKNVYSCDGSTVYNWKAATRSFYTMRMADERLAVVKQEHLKFEEETKMAENIE